MSALSLRQEPVLDGEFDVEQVYVFRLQQLQKTFCLFLAQYETHFHWQVRGKFKKGFFMQYSVPAKTGDRAYCRAAVAARLFGALQQPFEQEYAFVFAVFAYVEFKKDSMHTVPLSTIFFLSCCHFPASFLARLSRAWKPVLMLRHPFDRYYS